MHNDVKAPFEMTRRSLLKGTAGLGLGALLLGVPGGLDAQRFRAARVVIDIGVHCGLTHPDGGIWDADKAWAFLQNHSAMAEENLANGWMGASEEEHRVTTTLQSIFTTSTEGSAASPAGSQRSSLHPQTGSPRAAIAPAGPAP